LQQHRIALVGEPRMCCRRSARRGLNMGLRDAADIADIVREAMLSGEDPGSATVLKRYDSAGVPISPAGHSPSMPQTAHC